MRLQHRPEVSVGELKRERCGQIESRDNIDLGVAVERPLERPYAFIRQIREVRAQLLQFPLNCAHGHYETLLIKPIGKLGCGDCFRLPG